MAGDIWEKIPLSEIIDVKHGFAFPGQNIREEPPGDVLLTPGNFAVGGGFKGDKFKYFDGQVPEEYVLHENDLIVTMTDLSKQADTLGFPALVPKPRHFRYLHNQRLGKIVIRDSAKVDKPFLSYLLRTPEYRHEILAGATGTTVKHTSPSRILAFKTLIPPLSEQCAIAHILGTLDDKIELNRRMNETLEAMARALFKSWFVDFDPVRAKAEGRDPGLPQPLADLFPDSFENSELGEIPKGWSVEPLSEITTVITKGTTPTQSDTGTDDEVDAGINYVRVNAVDEDGAVLFDKLTKIPESIHLGMLKRSVLQAGDVLYSIAGTIGRSAIVEESLLPANTNQAVAIVRPKREIPATFLVMTMREAAFREELHSNIVQAVQANLSLGMLSKARIVVPPKSWLLQLFMPIAELMKRVSSIRAESRTLTALRDTLLPKLMSGGLRVPADAIKVRGHT